MSTEIAEETRFTVADDVVSEEIEEEMVLLDLQGDLVLSLNPVARCIWQSIAAGEPFSVAVDAVCRQFEIDRPTARRDAQTFLREALERELVEIGDGT